MNLPELFRIFLKTKGVTPTTVKNYVSDVVHFLSWLKQKTGIDYHVAGQAIFGLVTKETLEEYKDDQIAANTPLATINRRLSALRKLAAFGHSQGWLPVNSLGKTANVTAGDLNRSQNIPEVLAAFRKHLIGEKVSPLTVKNYLSDVRHFLKSQTSVSDYQQWLAKDLQLSPATVKRRLSSIRKFSEWAQKQECLTPPIPDRNLEGTHLRGGVAPAAHLGGVISSLYDRYQSISITKYLHYAILIIFCAALGFGAYDQFFRQAPTPLAYPTALTRPNRYLSFQGRLTDSSNNPITSATNLVFKLYDASSGGNTLWTSGTCSITPDSDGIFSTLLGSSCGTEIAATVFSENVNIWVGITVGADAEMTPRIQIATVGYAMNAETLQGYPPGTGTSTIPYLNSTGTLLLAAASPTIQSNSGTFGIKGQALSITTAANSSGNITLAPDGSGVLNLTLSAPTGKVINATDANLGASGQKEENTLIYGSVANTNTNVNLLKLEAGSTPAPKFTVDSAGNASAAGILKALGSGNNYFAGNVGIGTTSPSSLLSVGATSQFQVNSSGDMVKIKNVSYSWPSSQGAADTVLNNDGSGNLSWGTIGSGGITPDSLDFTEFQDTLDLDANLILNQSTYTWTQNFTGTTTTGLTYNANSLTTGTGLSLSSTSTGLTTGSLLSLDWSPGSATTATGDLLSINIGASGNIGNLFNIKDSGSSLFSVSETAMTSNLPSSFTSSGDVSIAYDLTFTNQTASYIKSSAPLTIEAGESFESNDLTLKTYNSGDVVFDAAGGVTLAQAQAWDIADSSTTSLNIKSGLLNLDTTNSRVGIGTTAPLQKLHIEGSCLVGNTLLPIRRKKRSKKSSGNKKWEYLFERISQVRPGDEVLSLDEFTGKVKWQVILALKDMGVREIFELTTRSGRKIRTTANHPYLVRI